MNITIDARMYGLEHAGIGRYIKNITHQLLRLDQKNHYHLLLPQKHTASFKSSNNLSITPVDIKHYTLSEQLQLPRVISSTQPDLVHFPHFNVPLTYKKPFVVTIHDILWHQIKGPQVTTLSPLKYAVKYQGYRLVMKHAVSKSRQIIVPSDWVKSQILQAYPKLPSPKIVVTHEAVDDDVTSQALRPSISTKFPLNKPYIIYVGSAYPHKNLKRLIQAINFLIQNKQDHHINLAIVGSRNVFLSDLKAYVGSLKLNQRIIFTGYASDPELKALIMGSRVLVQPSLSEGFGLTGLEAMTLGTPVISSNHGSLPEVYQDAALYINPYNHQDIGRSIAKLLTDKELREELIAKGKTVSKKYSWKKTAQQTLKVYQSAHSSTI